MNFEENILNSKCGICEDEFKNKNELQTHIQYHIDKIEELDITTLTNGHDLYEYNLFSFKSGLGDSTREHFIDHVNYRTEEQVDSAKEVAQPAYKRLLDEYDEDGNYIEYDPSQMDSESKYKTDNEI